MQRRVPQDFVDIWDAWLQESLHATRGALGERWLEVYLTSPIWRFVLAEGVCGGCGYAGVMVPSVDRVGRYFPLAIIAPLGAGACLVEAACGAGRPWFDAAESLALAALEAGDLDLDAFDAQVEALDGPEASRELAQAGELMDLLGRAAFARDGSAWHVSMPGETPQRAVNALASIELERAFRPCAMWWTVGSEAVEPGWLVSRGLPDPGKFPAMLTGRWREVGWSSIDLPGIGGAPGGEASTRLEIQVAHPASRHDFGAACEPRFVSRPEIGLWGIVCVVSDGLASEPGTAADDPALPFGLASGLAGGLDAVSDGAHDLAPQATLTALVEDTRRMLQRTRAFRRDSASAGRCSIGALFLLAQGDECALVWSGAMQAVRVSGGIGTPMLAASAAAEADCVTTGVSVCYERLRTGDLWALGAAAALPDDGVRRLIDAALAQSHQPVEQSPPTWSLDTLLTRCGPDPQAADAVPAMMLLGIRP